MVSSKRVLQIKAAVPQAILGVLGGSVGVYAGGLCAYLLILDGIVTSYLAYQPSLIGSAAIGGVIGVAVALMIAGQKLLRSIAMSSAVMAAIVIAFLLALWLGDGDQIRHRPGKWPTDPRTRAESSEQAPGFSLER